MNYISSLHCQLSIVMLNCAYLLLFGFFPVTVNCVKLGHFVNIFAEILSKMEEDRQRFGRNAFELVGAQRLLW